MMSQTLPKPPISLVSTVLSDRADCMEFLEQMALRSRRPHEIVVDGVSRDGSWEFLGEVPPMRIRRWLEITLFTRLVVHA